MAPEIGRDGMEDFVGSLLSDQGGAPFELVEQSPCPEEYVFVISRFDTGF